MKYFKLFFVAIFFSVFSFGQIGINTDTIDASAALDIRFNTDTTAKGLLTPRMTTVQRIGITNAANGLLVFDTDLKSFYYNEGTAEAPAWTRVNSGAAGRTNFKRIQSEADLIASSTVVGGNYQLISNTYYEINGAISLTKPIDLNNAYVSGLDANEDVLSFPGGTVFKGATGGSIKNVTLTGKKAFEIDVIGTPTSSLLVQNTIIANMSESVGSISGLGLYYGGIIQFVNNTNGIIYSNIGNCLLDNQAWLSSNKGTFEKFTGTFGLIEKGSGFSTVDGNDIAFDVSDTGLVVGTGTVEGTVFSGTTTNTAGYIKGYSTGSYTGFNFSNAWTVDSPGIPRESDAVATGDINLTSEPGPDILTTTNFTNSNTGPSTRKKIVGPTFSNTLFRFKKEGDNKLIYEGNKKRYFQIAASLSYQGAEKLTLIFYIAKNGTVVESIKVYASGTKGFNKEDGSIAVPLIGTLLLEKNDFIEIFVERYQGSGSMQTVSLNLTAR